MKIAPRTPKSCRWLSTSASMCYGCIMAVGSTYSYDKVAELPMRMCTAICSRKDEAQRARSAYRKCTHDACDCLQCVLDICSVVTARPDIVVGVDFLLQRLSTDLLQPIIRDRTDALLLLGQGLRVEQSERVPQVGTKASQQMR